MELSQKTVEDFFGVYLLYCKNPKYLGRTYIGYTVNPTRRIKQHNKGAKAGGAWRTSKRGPWEMVMIIHGFPNDIAALRFEWAWQHPTKSRRLNHIAKKKAKEKSFDYSLRILSEMLRVGPWNRLPLTIRWVTPEYCRDFPIEKTPPFHMPISYGTVITKKLPKTTLTQASQIDNLEITSTPPSIIYETNCSLCQLPVDGDRQLHCLNNSCSLVSHIICLSRCFLNSGDVVPIDGTCPVCQGHYLWGDIVRKFKGCSDDVGAIDLDEGGDAFYNSDSEDDS